MRSFFVHRNVLTRAAIDRCAPFFHQLVEMRAHGTHGHMAARTQASLRTPCRDNSAERRSVRMSDHGGNVSLAFLAMRDVLIELHHGRLDQRSVRGNQRLWIERAQAFK